MPLFESSPEHAASTNSDGEALLLMKTDELATMSPPYVKAPLEDRSKYEKLLQNNEDVSSEDTSHDEIDLKIEKKKRRSKMRNLPLIKNLRNDKKLTNNRDLPENCDNNNSEDDSIGSASDLRDDANEDNEKGDGISETISASIKTCGSSAYHAECESMATHEDDNASRIVRTKLKNDTKPIEIVDDEDMLFVGHRYGEKPLLLDDELDSDCELKYDNSKWSIEKRNKKKEDLWIKPSSSFDDDDPSDVFAMAPFSKPKLKRKDIQRATILTIDTLQQPQQQQQEVKELSNNTSPCLYRQQLNPFLASNDTIKSTSNYGTVTVNSNVINIPVNYECAQFETNFTNEYHQQQKEENYFGDEFFYDTFNPNEQSHQQEPQRHQQQHQQQDSFNYQTFQTMETYENVATNDETSSYYNQSNLNEYKNKKEKKKDGGKSKYHLIEERCSDDGSVKKVNAYKKVSNKTKKLSTKLKTQVGFSNMSFEDFPSDDDDDRRINNTKVTPFEVLRDGDNEKINKYGSLKRIGNPFS